MCAWLCAFNFVLSIYLSKGSIQCLPLSLFSLRLLWSTSCMVSVYNYTFSVSLIWSLPGFLFINRCLFGLFVLLFVVVLFLNRHRGFTEYHGSTDLHAFYLSSAVSAQTLLHCISSLSCPHTPTPHTTCPQWPQPVFTRGLYTNTLIATCCHGTWPERMPERAGDPSRDQGLMGGASSSETSD